MDELKELKYLLLKEEIESLSALKSELKKLDNESRSHNEIIDRISPILSSIIKKSSIKDEKLLLEALTPIVFKLIEQNFTQSKDKMTKHLAPLITQAIREQIKSQKDEVVDALYPVLGNMISKYVSKTFEEMLNAINEQITNGLSFSTLTRKIKSKVKGVSETELLLSENAIVNIRSVFLIHKETGVVLSHAEHEENPIKEPEMVASMMTAIRSFVNEWIEKNEANQEIGTIEYGGSKIVLEASGYSYLAVIVDGLVSIKTEERIRNVLEDIVSNHWKEIKSFNGDLSNIPQESLNEKLYTLIDNSKKSVEKKKLSPIIYLIPILFLFFIGWLFYNSYIDNKIEEDAKKLLYSNSKLTMYRINPSVEDRILTLSGVSPSNELKHLAQSSLKNIDKLDEIVNDIVVVEQQEKIVYKENKIEERLDFLLTALNLNENINITYSLNEKNELTLKGQVSNKKEKEYILKQFKTIVAIKTIKDEIIIPLPTLDTIIYFDFNSVKIDKIEEKKLIDLISILSKLDSDLILKAYVSIDDVGDNNVNLKLRTVRAKKIKEYLEIKGKVSQKIEIIELDSTSNEYEKIKTKHKRYITFSLESRNK